MSSTGIKPQVSFSGITYNRSDTSKQNVINNISET
jgi:hypothetical protein